MTGWGALEAELAHWDAPPTMWWRDDDAQAASPALDRLIAQAERAGAPLHLGVIPEGLSDTLRDRLERAEDVWVLQHGLRHKNHEPKGLRPSEIGESRDLALQRADLAEGWAALQGMPRLLPVIAPPWNRIGAATARALPGWGYTLLTTHGPRAEQEAVPGLMRVNLHFDPIRWKGGAHFRGVEGTLKSLVAHLAYRRKNDRDEPTGLTTHHLQTDDATWAFQDALLDRLAGRVRWVRLADRMEGTWST
ncbi:MAG: polysaccharide deacetylase family protein [Pseudomonadota bacterium]